MDDGLKGEKTEKLEMLRSELIKLPLFQVKTFLNLNFDKKPYPNAYITDKSYDDIQKFKDIILKFAGTLL